MMSLEVNPQKVDVLYPERSKYNNFGTIIKRLDEKTARKLVSDAEKQLADVEKAIEHHKNMAESLEDHFLKKAHQEALRRREEEYGHLQSTKPDEWLKDLKERLVKAEAISPDVENGQKQRDSLFKDLMLTACVCNKSHNEEEMKKRVMLYGSVCSMEEVIERNTQNSQRMEEMKAQYVRSEGMKHDKVQRNIIPSRTGLTRAF